MEEKKEVKKIDVKEMDLKSLKALAYDLLTNIQMFQDDLFKVNSKIRNFKQDGKN